MTHGPKHAYCVQRLKYLDVLVKPHGYHVRQQLPITLSDNREPEPDKTIVHGTIDEYQDRHPGPSDCLAAIAVADTSLKYDRTVKAQIYATAEIRLYGIINLPADQIEVYQAPLLQLCKIRTTDGLQVRGSRQLTTQTGRHDRLGGRRDPAVNFFVPLGQPQPKHDPRSVHASHRVRSESHGTLDHSTKAKHQGGHQVLADLHGAETLSNCCSAST